MAEQSWNETEAQDNEFRSWLDANGRDCGEIVSKAKEVYLAGVAEREAVLRSLEAFIDAGDEVLFEGNLTFLNKMFDAYIELRSSMGRAAVARLRNYMLRHPGLAKEFGLPVP